MAMQPLNKPPSRGPSFSVIIVAVGFVFLAIAYSTYVRPEYRVNQEFKQTEGRIIDKRLLIAQDRNGTVYRPEFHVNYEVDGRTYNVWTYNITADTTSHRASQEEILNNYEIGRSYPCWYDPLDPQVAVLVRGYSAFGFILAGFGLLVTLIGLVSLM